MGSDVSDRGGSEKRAPTISAVVMAFNEESSLAEVVQEIDSELRAASLPYEILVVDDGSQDATGRIADELAASNPFVRVIHHQPNRGLGAVYRTGFAEARGEWLTFFPADGQFPASIIGNYLAASGDADMILGTLPRRDDPLVARALSLAERVLLRVLFGHFPRFQGILMFRRALLANTPLVSQGRGWTILMELVLRATRGGARLKNVPTTIRPRASGKSKVTNLRNIASNLRQVLALRLSL